MMERHLLTIVSFRQHLVPPHHLCQVCTLVKDRKKWAGNYHPDRNVIMKILHRSYESESLISMEESKESPPLPNVIPKAFITLPLFKVQIHKPGDYCVPGVKNWAACQTLAPTGGAYTFPLGFSGFYTCSDPCGFKKHSSCSRHKR